MHEREAGKPKRWQGRLNATPERNPDSTANLVDRVIATAFNGLPVAALQLQSHAGSAEGAR